MSDSSDDDKSESDKSRHSGSDSNEDENSDVLEAPAEDHHPTESDVEEAEEVEGVQSSHLGQAEPPQQQLSAIGAEALISSFPDPQVGESTSRGTSLAEQIREIACSCEDSVTDVSLSRLGLQSDLGIGLSSLDIIRVSALPSWVYVCESCCHRGSQGI